MTHQSPPVAIAKTKGSTMAARRRRMCLIMLLCTWKAGRIEGFSSSARSQLGQLSRGGDTAEEDKQLDEYIEDLVSIIESSEDYSSEEFEEENETAAGASFIAKRPNDEEMDPDIVNSVGDDDDEEETEESVNGAEEPKYDLDPTRRKDAAEDILDPNLTKNDCGDNAGGEGNESTFGVMTSSPDAETEGKPRKSKKKLSSQDALEKELFDDNQDVELDEASPALQSLAPARPPNALYRFLLNQGRIGHILIMFCVLFVELVKMYIPPLAHFLGFIFSFLLPQEEDHPSSRRKGPPQKVNAQYAAFVSSDGSSIRGTKGKEQVRKADKQAVEKLRRVGSIQDSKFRHVSIDFMKRHHIGPYRDADNTEELVVYEAAPVAIGITGDEEESDVDWVVKALSKEDVEKSVPFKTPFGVGLGSSGASISVGVEFGSAKKRKGRKTLEEAASEFPSKPKQRPVGPRTSDREGGGGVIGRIRAVGANNLVSRSLLGAYPGDAVPPSEAACATGVISLAEKYGFGDWSDGEGDDVNEFKYNPPHRKDRKKKRKPTSSSVKLEFGLSSTNSNRRSSTAVSPKRPSSTRRRDDESANPVPFTSSSEILTASKLFERRRVRVRPPMEKLNKAQPSRTRSATKDSSKNPASSFFETSAKLPERGRVQVRPPMEMLNEARSKLKEKKDKE